MAAIDVGSLGISLPIAFSADKNVAEAVDEYNSSLKQTTFNATPPELKIIANKQGIGLAIKF